MGGKCSWCLRRTSVSVFRSAGAVTIPCRQTQKDRRNVNTVSKCSWLFLSFSPFLFPSSSLSHTRSHSGYVWVDMPAWVDGSYFYESLVLLQMCFFLVRKFFIIMSQCYVQLEFSTDFLCCSEGPFYSPLMVLNLDSIRCTVFTMQHITGWDHTVTIVTDN